MLAAPLGLAAGAAQANRLRLRRAGGGGPPTGAPVLLPWTMRRGALTRASNTGGGVPLAGLMQVGGDPVDTWSIVSGNTTGITIDPATGAIKPTVDGGFGASNRTLTIRAQNAAGSAEAQLTIEIVPNAYSVSSPADVGTSGVGATSLKPKMGGMTILFSYGMTLLALTDNMRFNVWNTHSGRVAIKSEWWDDPSRWTKARRVEMINCIGVDLSAMHLTHHLPVTNTDADAQNVGKVDMETCQDCTVSDMRLGDSIDAVQIQQWSSGVRMSNCSGCSIVNVAIYNCNNGLNPGNCSNCTFQGVRIDNFCSNAFFAGASSISLLIDDIVVVRPWRNPINLLDHQDFFQLGSVAGGTISGNTLRNARFYTADGNAAPQGPFNDDNGPQVGWTYENVYCDGAKKPGIAMYAGTYDLRRCTLLRAANWNIGQADAVRNSPAIVTNIFNAMLQTVWGTATSGTADGLVALDTEGDLSGFPDINLNNYWIIDRHGNLPASVGSNSTNNNGAALEAWYASLNLFNDPDTSNLNFAAMTIDEIDAAMRLRFRAKLDGALKRPDGSYHGMWLPDGSLNDGLPYAG